MALALCGGRALFTYIAARISSKLANDPPVVRKWGWSSLVSQAGLALGLGTVVKNSFPSIGDGLGSMVIAAVAINEMIGPVLFKMALDRSGESDRSEPAARPSLAPPPPEPAH